MIKQSRTKVVDYSWKNLMVSYGKEKADPILSTQILDSTDTERGILIGSTFGYLIIRAKCKTAGSKGTKYPIR